MKKDKLFSLLQDFIYGLEPQQTVEGQLVKTGVNITELWGSVDWFLEKIAEKYGED